MTDLVSDQPGANVLTAPNVASSLADPTLDTRPGQPAHDAHVIAAAAGTDSDSSQRTSVAQCQPAAVGHLSDRPETMQSPTPMADTSLADPFLALAADVLDDAERTRISNENRLRQLTRTATDRDGEDRGFGLDASHPDVARLAALVDMLAQVEHQAGLNLKRLMRQHPLSPWIKAQKGIGDKQAARLLAVIGDPCVNEQTGEDRSVSQLWAYCGHGDPTRKRRKGMTQADLFALGNPVAKSRTWLIACAVLKAQGPLSAVYYDRKAATEGRLHANVCVRCGPSGHPAQPDSPWSDAHRHADALRIAGKEILRGLWLEARRLHGHGEQEQAA